MSKGSAKGSQYERDMCRRLSLWWTANTRDDVFWRSAGSGGRAKVRGRAGRNTAGQHGDVAATDPIGAPLIDVVTIEIKRGYSTFTTMDVLDALPTAAIQTWEGFLAQAIESYEQAGSLAWLLVTHRNRRVAMAWMPWFLFTELRRVGAWGDGYPTPFARFRLTVRLCKQSPQPVEVCGMQLTAWLEGVCPGHIQELAEVR